ncbi:MAG TPA: uroporphyrinogen-III synthase [Chitinophagales bacterium]|nr:uroporphyrinogen-III synthase [Chitinophagales bacterium]HMZ88368.1 uroporphyrinogen-III synthase [Chitinophagales bacterium]HNA58522.1 uroporphyrinogen-III synthase [Chitinophagales bacterium]HNE45382.1 uroporphyrinogen-III synthase [Chitinophagales bacterium]HNF69428.1 uroporphyrinogen-III synthase [Chitinophagales bacterium]
MNKPQPTSLKPVKSILVSQPKPPEVPKSPYQEIAEKYKIKVEFRQFIQVRGLSSKDFRKQRINILDYTAVIFTSRNAIDHFFRICEELRIRMPEMTKYFCVTEAIAVYLQKYIQYRKRKVFFGTGKDTDMFDLFKKHISEKFLFPCTVNHKDIYTEYLKSINADFSEAFMYETVPADLSDLKGKIDYDMIILYTPTGVASLFQNFPGFEQGDLRIGCMGASTLKAMEEQNLRVDLKAPSHDSPSITMALDKYLAISNKKK